MKKRIIIALVLTLALIIGAMALVIGVSAEDEAPALEINGANVSFDESVHLLYSVGYKNVASPENIKLLVWREAEGIHVDNLKKGTEDYVLDPMKNAPQGLSDNSVAFKFTDIAAAEMTENFYVRAYYVEDGEEILSSAKKYSVLQYAMNKLGYTGTATEDQLLREMLFAMLEYGATAQKYFGVNTDRLANEPYFKITLKGATFEDGMTTGLFRAGTEVTVSAKTTEELPYVLWTDEDGNVVGGENTCTLKVDSNMTVSATLTAEKSSFGAYDRVVIIGVDGAGSFYPDNINENSKRIQEKIFGEGAVTHTMRTVSPSSSCPAWTSCLHGVNPVNHLQLINGEVEASSGYTMDSKYPSILRVIKEADPSNEVAAIYGWSGIGGIVESEAGITRLQASDADLTNYIVNTYLPNNDPKALFVHLHNPDYIGHTIGHHTEEYYASIDTAYTQIEAIYDALAEQGLLERTLFMVTADHGGIGLGHGGLTDSEKYVMLAAAGHTVEKGGTIPDAEIRDVAAISLYALGIKAPETYTAGIPAGLFEGFGGQERSEYHDPDSPRYHVPEATPALGTVDNFVNKNLVTYLPFDGNTDEVYGKTTDEFGKIAYEDGWYGQGVVLDDGHININGFQPGNDSFTIAMWIKTPSAHGTAPVITNKAWDTNGQGFALAFERATSSSGETHYARFNFGNGKGISATKDYDLPSDFTSGWMHVTLVFDRENEQMRLCYDFGEVYSFPIHSSWGTMEGTNMTSIYDYITLGNDATGNAKYKIGLSIDELMIFDGAFTKDDIAGLAEYFGKETEEASAPETDIFADDKKPDLFFGFNGNHEFIGDSPAFAVQENLGHNFLTYGDGKDGQAAYFSGTEYETLTGLKLGTESFSVAMWINPQDLSFGGGSRYKLPLVSNAGGVNRENQGFNILLDTEYQRLVVTFGNGAEKKGMQEYVDFPKDTYEGKWTHIAVAYDRETGYIRIYVNFHEVLNKKMVYNGTNTAMPSDLPLDSDYPVRIGQYGLTTTNHAAKVYIDNLMIFTRDIDSSDVFAIAEYYRAPMSDYLDKAPVVDLDFNGGLENEGSYDGAITDGGITFTEGYLGNGATFGDSAGVDLSDLTLDGDKYTISFMMNTDNFGFGFAFDNYWYRNIFSMGDENNTESQGLQIIHKGDLGSRGGVMVNIADGNGKRAYAGWEFPADMEIGDWVLVTIVIDKTKNDIDLYYNGNLAVEFWDNSQIGNVGSLPLDGAEGFTPHIGTDGDGTWAYPYTERIDEFTIFDSALTADEIVKLYEYYNQ